MAKRDPRHPALRGYQVWRWIKKGILEAKPLGETPILIVQKAARVRLSSKYRTTISQGIFLVPRWIPAPKDGLKKFSRLSTKELEAKEIIKRRGVLYLLIYQQVEDLSHLYRQQRHILFDGVRMRIFNLRIKPYIVKRKEVAAELAKQRAKQLRVIRERKLNPLLKRLATPKKIEAWEIEGMIQYLNGVIDELDEILERPLVPRRKRAQRSLRSAQEWIRRRNFSLARKRLQKALANLTWPRDESHVRK